MSKPRWFRRFLGDPWISLVQRRVHGRVIEEEEDLSGCPYARGLGYGCGGCWVEPRCVTDEPLNGWPSTRWGAQRRERRRPVAGRPPQEARLSPEQQQRKSRRTEAQRRRRWPVAGRPPQAEAVAPPF